MRNRRAFSFALVLSFIVATSGSSGAVKSVSSEQRVALVIGNSDYATAPLKNPVNDAQDIAEALRKLGFDVMREYEKNLKQEEMERAIRAFGKKIRNGGVGLFYYAGHGIQSKGINYLIPVDAKVESEGEVRSKCVDAGLILAQMESAGNRLNIMILDACRNNPFGRSYRSDSRGLALMDAPSGSLIAFATAPNSIASDGDGRNGLYTQELLKFLPRPGLKIEELLKEVRKSVGQLTKEQQVPWYHSSLRDEFYFVQPPPSVKPEELLEIIKSQQQSEVRESYGEFRGQNFSEEDLKVFKEKEVPRLVAERLKRDAYFTSVVLAISRMELGAQRKLLNDGRQTYKKTWKELGGISREGQTDAGQEGERLIAKAIVDLVLEKVSELRR